MVDARVRRQQVAYTQSRDLSDRRACAVLSVARSTLGYQSRLAVRDAPALAAMRRLAPQYPRYGYRRIRIFLRREGHVMSPDRAHRLWRHAGLQVPRRRPRRRVATGRPRPLPPTARNHVWAYDFVFDTCANRQTLKCLTIVDEWTRECLAIDVAGTHPLWARDRGARPSSSACTAPRGTCGQTTDRSSWPPRVCCPIRFLSDGPATRRQRVEIAS